MFVIKNIGDDPQACRRRNHNMVEKGVHIVPTLRNRVVIFNTPYADFIKSGAFHNY